MNMKDVKTILPGVVVCLLITIPIWITVNTVSLLEVIGAPILAILSGMIISLLIHDKTKIHPGISFISKKVLQFAVILLGFGLNLMTIGRVGLTSLPIILSTITTSLVVAFFIHKALNVPAKISTLIGVGSSICGGSAIAATAPVINADDSEIATSISVIFLFNVIAAIIFPAIGSFLRLSNHGFALFAGTAINDTSSVTAAASTWDTIHGTEGSVLAYATIVKLTRTLAIIPISMILSYVQTTRIKKKQGREIKMDFDNLNVPNQNIFPTFILYFLFASIFTTLTTTFCSSNVLSIFNLCFNDIKISSKFFIVMAMAAIGLNTDIVKLVKQGGKAIVMGFWCWISITCVSLILQNILNLL